MTFHTIYRYDENKNKIIVCGGASKEFALELLKENHPEYDGVGIVWYEPTNSGYGIVPPFVEGTLMTGAIK